MNSLSASLQFWLKSQCQTHDKVTQSVLLIASNPESPKMLASYPDTSEIPPVFTDAIAQVIEKQRLYLTHLNDQQVIFGHPVFLHNHFWGAVIIQLEASGKTATQNAIKNLQKGLVWLQFLLHEQQRLELQRQEHLKQEHLTEEQQKQEQEKEQDKQKQHQAHHEQLPAQQTNDNSTLIKSLLKENSLAETAIYLANTLASLLHASRVSIGWKTEQSIKLAAVSASASFDARTEAMQLLTNTMLEACDQGTDIALNNDANHTDNPTLVVHHHQQLLQQQSLQGVHTFLVRKELQLLGAIIIEQVQKPPLSAAEQHFLQSLLPVLGDIILLKQRAEAGLWQSLKQRCMARIGRWFSDTQRGKKIIAGVITALIIVLLLPLQYHVTSDASLQSVYKHLVVAPQDGFLKIIAARPGNLVSKGDVLAQLNDDEMRLEERKVRSQWQQYEQEYDQALAISNRADAAIASAKMDQATIQLRLLEQQLQRAQLLAPADGIVVSDDISQTLGAPIKQGDLLFEIAATTGYLVQLFVDEREIAAISVGQTGHIKLTSLPSETFEFRVKNITPISEVRNGRNYFRVEATLTRETEQLRTGMTGSGKIVIGRRVLIWIWFHDIWHWLRLSLWW